MDGAQERAVATRVDVRRLCQTREPRRPDPPESCGKDEFMRDQRLKMSVSVTGQRPGPVILFPRNVGS